RSATCPSNSCRNSEDPPAAFAARATSWIGFGAELEILLTLAMTSTSGGLSATYAHPLLNSPPQPSSSLYRRSPPFNLKLSHVTIVSGVKTIQRRVDPLAVAVNGNGSATAGRPCPPLYFFPICSCTATR